MFNPKINNPKQFLDRLPLDAMALEYLEKNLLNIIMFYQRMLSPDGLMNQKKDYLKK